MSREQWGNGYWKGVHDAQNGHVKTDFANIARFTVCQMCIMNHDAECSRLVFPVTKMCIWLEIAGLPKGLAKRIYDYILINEPYGCYVSGESWQKWTDDCFILPMGTKEDWQAEADKIAKAGVIA